MYFSFVWSVKLDYSQLSEIQHPRLRILDAHLRSHIRDSITLTDAAIVTIVSPSFLSALVREELDIAFTRWLTYLGALRHRLVRSSARVRHALCFQPLGKLA